MSARSIAPDRMPSACGYCRCEDRPDFWPSWGSSGSEISSQGQGDTGKVNLTLGSCSKSQNHGIKSIQAELEAKSTHSKRDRLDLNRLNDLNVSVTNGEDASQDKSWSTDESTGIDDIMRTMPTSEPSSSSSRPQSTAQVFLNGNRAPGLPPHRSMLKALASRSSNENLRQNRDPSQLSLSDLANPMTSFAARFTHSPCFFHKRFDDAVNVDRVLEEIAADDGMSHSRLLQTATSVREIAKQLQRRPIKRAVRTIMIVTKARDNRLVYLTRELTHFLLSTPRYNSDLGVTVYVDAKLAKSKRFDAEGLVALNPSYKNMLRYWTPSLCCSSPEKFDLVLTLGGDGTVLYTSWLFQRIVPPILSFSLGSLGFLTNFSYSAYKPTLDRIMEGSGMRVNMRMRFTCTVYRSSHNRNPPKRRSRTSSLASTTTTTTTTTNTTNSPSSPAPISSINTTSAPMELDILTPSATFEVLNELVLDRGPSPYVSNLELYGDSQLLTIIQADGCIISTPTGSTAYSLSAGGPLCHPSIPGILLTPICPHTLSFRPMVLSDSMMLRLVVPKTSRSTAYASFDGKGRVELRRGDEVRVEAGRYPFPTVVGEAPELGGGEEWFESVRRALRWNNRGVVQGGWGGRLADQEETGEFPLGLVGRESKRDGLVALDGAAHGNFDSGDQKGNDNDDENGHNDKEEAEDDNDEEEDWDIDADPIEVGSINTSAGLDSGIGGSVDGGCATGGKGGEVGGENEEAEKERTDNNGPTSPTKKNTSAPPDTAVNGSGLDPSGLD